MTSSSILRPGGPLRALIAVAMVVAWAHGPGMAARPQEEYQVKAAFLLNFMKYIEWPSSALAANGGAMTVVLVGQRGAGQIEEWLGGKTALSRPVAVRRANVADQIGACHLLFVASDAEKQLTAALRAIAGQPVVSVSDVEDEMTTDALINLSILDGRVAFSVNLDAADAAGLQVSSKLLALARRVRQDGREK